jgi:putative membrane protein
MGRPGVFPKAGRTGSQIPEQRQKDSAPLLQPALRKSVMRRPLLMLATCVALAAPAYAAAPRAFVIDAIKADNSEIMLGQMAKQQASSRNVRDFGQTLVTDHTQAKQQMSSVANELDVTLPTGPTDEAQKE